MTDDNPSDQVVLQRIRNRIVEELELASSFEAQRKYDTEVPIAHVPSEVICGWEDWVDDERMNDFATPVFSEAEIAAIKVFHEQWKEIVDSLPDKELPLDEVQNLPIWKRLSEAAQKALKAFAERGKLPEDHEV